MAHLPDEKPVSCTLSLSFSKHSCVNTKLYYNRNVPNGAHRRFAQTQILPRHDGCLYEAVIYFIIGGRAREGVIILDWEMKRFTKRAPPRAQQKFDRSDFIDRVVSLARLRPRIEITLLVKAPVFALESEAVSGLRSFGKGRRYRES